MDDQERARLRSIATIVAAIVSKNTISAADIPGFMQSVGAALYGQDGTKPPPVALPVNQQPPAVPIKKSITPEFLISLENGKSFRTLKRHLAKQGLTPEAYRIKWGLPSDYPMVAPNYSATRARLAKSIGLGSRGRGGAKKADAEG